MRFDLDEQQRAFQDAVVDYLRTECPMNRALEPHEHGHADLTLWRGLMELGIGGMVVPEEYGGLGLGLLDLAVVAEPVGRYAMPGPFFEHALATLAITIAGSDEQKAKWLPALVTGELRATVALAEAKGEWTADTWTLEGEGHLTGRKQYVLHTEGADLIVVGLKGGALAVVHGDASGIKRTVVPSTDAGRTLAHLEFNQVAMERLPLAAGQSIVDAGLILLAADAFGGASQAVQPLPQQVHVCAAKAGVNMVVKVLAMEWGQAGIRVNAISPGPILGTEGVERMAPTEEDKIKWSAHTALRRFGTPSDIAQAAIFLSSDNGSYITGTILDCDGGMKLGDASGDFITPPQR